MMWSKILIYYLETLCIIKLIIASAKLVLRNEGTLDSPIRYGMSIGDKRRTIRFDCDYKCFLQHNGLIYLCQLNNFSISGALVCLLLHIPFNIQLGDTCDLTFSTSLTMSHQNYKSKVTRLNDSKIALQFLDIDNWELQQPPFYKDECLILAKNCDFVDETIMQRVERLNTEIGKGTDVYTPEELKFLQQQLDLINSDSAEYSGGAN